MQIIKYVCEKCQEKFNAPNGKQMNFCPFCAGNLVVGGARESFGSDPIGDSINAFMGRLVKQTDALMATSGQEQPRPEEYDKKFLKEIKLVW